MVIGDRAVDDLPPNLREVGIVFQNYALYPHMRVYDNIGFALKMSKTPKSEIDERVNKAAKILELSANLDSKPGQLSGGQRQRVAMGRAIVRQPSAFLMDEPLSNLDAKLRVQMRAEISSIQRELGVTTIYVTHDQVEAMTMGDRVAVLKDGYLQQVDTPQHLYDHPINVFVAAFIGSPSMNLYEAQLDGQTLRLGSQTLAVDPLLFDYYPTLTSYNGRNIIVGIRPEDFEDASLVESSSVDRRLTAPVSLLEALGSEIVVHFSIDAKIVDAGDSDAAVVVKRVGQANSVGRFDPRSRVRHGDVAEIAVNTENLHFFDPQTHLNLRA